MNIATEIVTMKTATGIKKEQFLAIVTDQEQSFHSKLEGFIDSELMFDEQAEEWIMIQHWHSLELMRKASQKMFGNPLTEAFVAALEPQSVKMRMLPQCGTWPASSCPAAKQR